MTNRGVPEDAIQRHQREGDAVAPGLNWEPDEVPYGEERIVCPLLGQRHPREIIPGERTPTRLPHSCTDDDTDDEGGSEQRQDQQRRPAGLDGGNEVSGVGIDSASYGFVGL